MERKKVLFVVEGEVEEVNILKNKGMGLLNVINCDYEILTFKNPIYELYDAYKKGEYDDLVAYLKYEKGLKIPKGVLAKEAFAAVYLVFDYEVQYQKYNDDIIKDILNTFNDETNLGKLYINYPMVEAFYHLKTLKDKDYLKRTISLKDLSGRTYKSLVKSETCIDRKKITKRAMQYIIKQNYEKALMIVGKNRKIIEQELILSKQIALKNKNNSIYVLTTLPLLLFDYNESLVKKLIENIEI